MSSKKFDAVTISDWVILNHDIDEDIEDQPEIKENDMFLVAIKWKNIPNRAYVWEFIRLKCVDDRMWVMENASVGSLWEESWEDAHMYARITELYE